MAGADLSNVVMDHLERTFTTDEQVLQFAELGCYLEYDMFGMGCLVSRNHGHYITIVMITLHTPTTVSMTPLSLLHNYV